jgi:hypothetical protein
LHKTYFLRRSAASLPQRRACPRPDRGRGKQSPTVSLNTCEMRYYAPKKIGFGWHDRNDRKSCSHHALQKNVWQGSFSSRHQPHSGASTRNDVIWGSMEQERKAGGCQVGVRRGPGGANWHLRSGSRCSAQAGGRIRDSYNYLHIRELSTVAQIGGRWPGRLVYVLHNGHLYA